MDLVTLEYVNKTGLKVIVYNSSTSSYPPRPAGVTAPVLYIGPVDPSDWLDNDVLLDIA